MTGLGEGLHKRPRCSGSRGGHALPASYLPSGPTSRCLQCGMHPPPRWGHELAEGAVGKGLGSRAMLAALKHGAAIHDASYWCPLELRGSAPNLAALLRAIRCLSS